MLVAAAESSTLEAAMAAPMEEGLLETWRINERVTRYVLDAIPAEALAGVSASKGRTVGAVFAHLHTARLMWLEVAASDLMEGLARVAKEDTLDKELLAR